ncbi:hypothetical protein BDV35DRAFT_5276 [Aspergillus flavus]|uniref:F-box domain-containing protein n=1 Tax=Aspergillus flavus TaxID=5059 RepID=A0A5N6HI43_ASPFL|nr:hypothetical protein BDV35DRAFT_5276 [Aspergillus flavus]
MVSIHELPHEILLLIINELETEWDISVFTQLNRFFYRCFTPYLYQHNVGQSKSSALVYAARYGRLSTATKAIELGGADPDLIASNQTVLSHAAKAEHAEICEFLLSLYNVKVDSRHIRITPFSSPPPSGTLLLSGFYWLMGQIRMRRRGEGTGAGVRHSL